MKILFKKLFLISAVSFLVSACGGQTLKYSGSGSFQDLANARNACAEHVCNDSRFNACVAAKGFYRSKQGRHDASSIKLYCQPGPNHWSRRIGPAVQEMQRQQERTQELNRQRLENSMPKLCNVWNHGNSATVHCN